MNDASAKSMLSISVRTLAVLLGGLAMFGPFSIDTIFPAFPAIGAQFGADKVAMQQTISVYLVAYAAMSIVHGPLSDAIGRRRVILGGLVVFAIASAGCALSKDLTTLLAFRALQGLSSGVGLIVGRAVIRDVLHGHDAQRLMSQVSMIFGVAPAVAPVIGGWILGWSHWPAIFWFLVVFAVVLLVATWRTLPETHLPEARLPMVPRRLLRDYVAIVMNPRFQRLAAASAFNFAALWMYIASAPAFVLDILKLSEREFGWFFVPMISGMVLGAFVSGRTAGKVSGERLVAIGFACSAVAMALNLGYNLWTDAPQLPWAVLPMMLNAFGIALVFPIVTLAILDMYPRQRGSASSLQAFTSLVLNALIAGVLSPWISDHALWLVGAAIVFLVIAWGFWRWEARVSRTACAGEAEAKLPGETL
ncbi:DHA1 family bicyclomycin/chloramphenicol resistance-like MFS transporter [Lysobacter niastensis]|uniref:Bcr/CflA family efflux transporter n=1 Tax=Lysobacter niastensis TaxID=380629 RepID=A0ABU1WFP6_9GAMM|nr:multidrug effflux MFS transporter [Lysobacter niastensis]MDR7136387.1 DHA1 family bicyclomycin/chloramphenicol resistance-like MFS transporter [Lysobacter niastensis]